MTALALASSRPDTAPDVSLAPLRDDLALHEGPRTVDGAPSWTLEDPSRGRYYRIGWAEMEMLARWGMADPAGIAESICAQTTLTVSTESVEAFARFLASSNLLQVSGGEAIRRLVGQSQAAKLHWAMWLLKNYLFVRIPLWRPERFLAAALPFVQPFYTRAFLLLTIGCGLLGLFLVARQWDSFTHSFLHFFTFEGAALAAVTLFFSKVLHELGHAFTSRRYGCRVSTMGVALLVMWPVLYTDTSAAWRLKDRHKRLAIGAAGMAVELALACYATVLWNFMPDGPARSAVFTLATTTWILTLVINLSPFMRFDGYFLASDLLNVPNLQDRAFKLARWKLREWLFALGDERPEIFPPRLEKLLILYAFGTWIYRFFLFLGIALLVYHFFFKLLGILLFAVEMVWFIGKPILSEVAEWVKRRGALRLNANTITTALLLLVGLGAVFYPWRSQVQAPALLRAEQYSQLYVLDDARLDSIAVAEGQSVKAGQPLFQFDAPDLDYQLAAAERDIVALRWQTAVRPLDLGLALDIQVVRQQLESALARRSALQQARDRLVVVAPFDGVLVDRADPLAPGEWVAKGDWLGSVIVPDQWVAEAYSSEADLGGLRIGGHGRFYPDDIAQPPIDMTITDIATAATRSLVGTPELASVYGGGIAAVHVGNNGLVPETAIYRVMLKPTGPIAAHARPLRGTMLLDAPKQSWASRLWTRALSVAIRETGF
jgi:putative peptide zinc metalloprotease protein